MAKKPTRCPPNEIYDRVIDGFDKIDAKPKSAAGDTDQSGLPPGFRRISGIERLPPDDALDARVFAFGDSEISAIWVANKHAAAKAARLKEAFAEVRRTWANVIAAFARDA